MLNNLESAKQNIKAALRAFDTKCQGQIWSGYFQKEFLQLTAALDDIDRAAHYLHPPARTPGTPPRVQ